MGFFSLSRLQWWPHNIDIVHRCNGREGNAVVGLHRANHFPKQICQIQRSKRSRVVIRESLCRGGGPIRRWTIIANQECSRNLVSAAAASTVFPWLARPHLASTYEQKQYSINQIELATVACSEPESKLALPIAPFKAIQHYTG